MCGGVTLALQAGGIAVVQSLRLQASTVFSEPWRLLTGHWVHLTWSHGLLNVATLAVFVALFPDLRRPWIFAGLMLGSVVGVDIGVLVGHPDVDWYVGFSGVLYGLLAGAIVLEGPRRPGWSALFAIGLSLKLARDLWLGTPATTEALVGGSVLAPAHVYGSIGGVVAAVLWRLIKRTSAPLPAGAKGRYSSIEEGAGHAPEDATRESGRM